MKIFKINIMIQCFKWKNKYQKKILDKNLFKVKKLFKKKAQN